MTFDTPIVRKLCFKYVNEPDFRVPQFVFLARSEKLIEERVYLERLLTSVATTRKKDLINRLVNEDDAQHLGAWFQIMLYGWLERVGTVEVEPQIAGNQPDFSVLASGGLIVVEARAVLVSKEERESDKREQEIISLLSQIKKPFVVSIENLVHAGQLDAAELFQAVILWLDQNANKTLTYDDRNGNRIILTAQRSSATKVAVVIGTSEPEYINADVLKAPLHEKARQHSAIRKAGYPYVLAIFLESWKYSAEEVVAAWLGRTQFVIDTNSNQVVEQRVDRSGIHFFATEILHRSVSGTLVFKRKWIESARKHDLESWYIQNPYASVRIDPEIFPVKARYIIKEQNTQSYSMGWI